MANLSKVVYLSEVQKETLFTNGSITVDGQTIEYSDNDLYITPNAIDVEPAQGSMNLITSGAVYNAINTKVNSTSPTFSGTPTAPTATAGTNTTQIATTAFVKTAIDNAIADNTYDGTVQAVN